MAVLSKLLKYDLRANLKIFLFIWPAILVFGLLERVALMAELPVKISAIFVNLTTVLFVLAVIAACVFALVISVIRFYSGLLRDEGYLMFTLPVRPWQLVLSKLLTALLTLVVTGLVSFVSVGILFGGIRGLLPSIRTSLEQSFGGIINGWGIALLVLLVVVQVAVSVLQIYLSCSIGHLFRRKRILFAVLFYYAINVVLETVAVTSIIVLSNFEPFCRFLVQLSAGMSAPGMFNLFIGVMLALLAVLGAVCISGVFTGSRQDPRGIAFGLAAALLYCSLILLNKRLRGLDTLETTFCQLCTAALVMLPYVLLGGHLHGLAPAPSTLFLLLVVGIVHTGLVYILFFSAVGRLPAQTTAVLSYVDPVTAILLATLFLHQPFGPAELCGTVLILGATLANELPGNRTAEAQS